MTVDAHIHIFSHPHPDLTPPEMADGRFPAERLVSLMDREGVDKAVLVQNPTIGPVNGEIAAVVKMHPTRLVGAVQVDPVSPGSPLLLRDLVSRGGFRALKLEMSQGWGWTGIYPELRLTSRALTRIWAAVAELGLVVIIDPGPPSNPGYQVEEISRLRARWPQVSFLIEHLGYLTKAAWDDAELRRRRLDLLRLALHANVHLGFSAAAVLLEEEYPCPRTAGLLEEAVGLVGAQKILWGSDAPYSLRRYAYRQMLDMVREHPKLTDGEKAMILGGNAARLFFSASEADAQAREPGSRTLTESD